MKEYNKPSLRGLGLLRVVTTQFSDPSSGAPNNGSGTGDSENSHKEWNEHGHGLPGELL